MNSRAKFEKTRYYINAVDNLKGLDGPFCIVENIDLIYNTFLIGVSQLDDGLPNDSEKVYTLVHKLPNLKPEFSVIGNFTKKDLERGGQFLVTILQGKKNCCILNKAKLVKPKNIAFEPSIITEAIHNETNVSNNNIFTKPAIGNFIYVRKEHREKIKELSKNIKKYEIFRMTQLFAFISNWCHARTETIQTNYNTILYDYSKIFSELMTVLIGDSFYPLNYTDVYAISSRFMLKSILAFSQKIPEHMLLDLFDCIIKTDYAVSRFYVEVIINDYYKYSPSKDFLYSDQSMLCIFALQNVMDTYSVSQRVDNKMDNNKIFVGNKIVDFSSILYFSGFPVIKIFIKPKESLFPKESIIDCDLKYPRINIKDLREDSIYTIVADIKANDNEMVFAMPFEQCIDLSNMVRTYVKGPNDIYNIRSIRDKPWLYRGTVYMDIISFISYIVPTLSKWASYRTIIEHITAMGDLVNNKTRMGKYINSAQNISIMPVKQNNAAMISILMKGLYTNLSSDFSVDIFSEGVSKDIMGYKQNSNYAYNIVDIEDLASKHNATPLCIKTVLRRMESKGSESKLDHRSRIFLAITLLNMGYTDSIIIKYIQSHYHHANRSNKDHLDRQYGIIGHVKSLSKTNTFTDVPKGSIYNCDEIANGSVGNTECPFTETDHHKLIDNIISLWNKDQETTIHEESFMKIADESANGNYKTACNIYMSIASNRVSNHQTKSIYPSGVHIYYNKKRIDP